MPLLMLVLLAAILATLFVQADPEQSLSGQLFRWMMITLGLIFLGWAIGVVTVVP